MKPQLGVMLTCYDEIEAVKYAVEQFRIYYPDTKIYLVTESKEQQYIKIFKNDKNIKVNYVEDSMSFYYNTPNLPIIYQTADIQLKIKKAVLCFLTRLNDAIKYCDSDYMLLMDPDVLIRGQLTISNEKKLLGSLANSGVPNNIKNILSNIEGAIPIDQWGATPGIFHTETFKKAYLKFLSIENLLTQLTMNWYAMYAHDIIIPIMFSLIGEREYYNNDFIECNTDPNWKNTDKKLVHHFKKYYKNATYKFPWWRD